MHLPGTWNGCGYAPRHRGTVAGQRSFGCKPDKFKKVALHLVSRIGDSFTRQVIAEIETIARSHRNGNKLSLDTAKPTVDVGFQLYSKILQCFYRFGNSFARSTKFKVFNMEEFAQNLMTFVRDRAIEDCDNRLKWAATENREDRWRDAVEHKSTSELAKIIIPDIVDSAIFYLLLSIDEGALDFTFHRTAKDPIRLSDVGKGELAGLPSGAGGWIMEYSKQQYNDDFANLKL